MSAWVLPDHIADVLPSEARHIEELRRGLLDTARCYGYELVMPPLLEHLESLLSGTGKALDLQTFKLVDQLSGRTMGLRAVFERSGMPPSLYPAFRAAIDVLHETEFDGSNEDRAGFRKRMIERVLTRFQSIPQDDLDYLLEKLDYVREETASDPRQRAFG